MSFGKNSSRSSTNQTTHNTYDPQIRTMQVANVQGLQGDLAAPAAMYTGQRVAGFTPLQVEAQQGLADTARAGLGGGTLTSAIAAAQAGARYAPEQMSTRAYEAAALRPSAQVGYDSAPVANAAFERVNATAAGAPAQGEAAAMARGAVRDLAGGTVTPEMVSRYMDPYGREVIEAALADIERQRAIQESLSNAQARKAGAFGGTGAAVAAALSNENFERQKALTAAQLRSQGYQTALGAAQADLDRGLQAGLSNQQADLSIEGANAQAANQMRLANLEAVNRRAEFDAGQHQNAALANQDAFNRASQFNAAAYNASALDAAQGRLAAGQTNAQLDQQRTLAEAAARDAASRFALEQAFAADQANQRAGLEAAQLGLSGAGLLGGLAGQERDFAYGDLERMLGVGAQQQALAQAQADAQYQDWLYALEDAHRRRELLNQGLGILGNPVVRTQTQGTSRSRDSSFSF